MLTQDSHPEINRQLLQALDDTLAVGSWDETLLLRTIGNKLRALREKYKHGLEFEKSNNHVESKKDVAMRVAERAGQTEVFVSLYNVKGADLTKWSKCLQTLSSTVLTRPVYGKEHDVKARMRAKIHDSNEAYAVIYVDKKAILEPEGKDDIMQDRLGHPLLSIKEGAITAEKITRFVHVSGQYTFENGKLVRQNKTNPTDFI